MIGDIFQPTHLLFVLIVALLVLGPKRLPEVGRSLGRGIRDFRSAISGDELHSEIAPLAPTPTTTPTEASTAQAATTTAPGAAKPDAGADSTVVPPSQTERLESSPDSEHSEQHVA